VKSQPRDGPGARIMSHEYAGEIEINSVAAAAWQDGTRPVQMSRK
jgi:hypothetical protein